RRAVHLDEVHADSFLSLPCQGRVDAQSAAGWGARRKLGPTERTPPDPPSLRFGEPPSPFQGRDDSLSIRDRRRLQGPAIRRERQASAGAFLELRFAQAIEHLTHDKAVRRDV